MTFVAIAVVAAIAEYIWYRRARRKRRAERLQSIIQEAALQEMRRPFDLSPRDVAQLREMVEEAHRSPRA
jgi:hypothetical protein